MKVIISVHASGESCCLLHLQKGARAPVARIEKLETKLLPNAFQFRFWSKCSSKQPQNMDLQHILLAHIQDLSFTEKAIKSLTLEQQDE